MQVNGIPQPKRTSLAIVKDWAKYTQRDLEDDVLANAYGNGALLESIAHTIPTVSDERIEIVFTHLMYGAFQDAGIGRKGHGSFKPNRWYARNMAYSAGKLAEMMMSRYASLGKARVLEVFPKMIKL